MERSNTAPDFGALMTFVEVVERGSFTAAARRLGVSKSIASRRVQSLERQLRVRLLHRTTRGLTPTEAGAGLHARCRVLLRELEEACEQAGGHPGDIVGTVRLTAPASFAQALVVPVVAALAREHPRLRFRIELDERRLDLVGGGFDVAIRAGVLPDSTLASRTLGMIEGVVVASPAYLAAHGAPGELADLASHACLDHGELHPGGLWRFVGSGGELLAPPIDARIEVNSFDALQALALAGAGLAALPRFTAAEALASGALAPVLEQHPLMRHTLSALFPPLRQPLPKLRLLLDRLTAHAAMLLGGSESG